MPTPWTCPLIEDLLEAQLRCNLAIAEEGFAQRLGRQRGLGDSGRVPGQPQVRRQGLGRRRQRRPHERAVRCPWSSSPARGNQGITASVPVARYAHHLGASKEKLYRALLLSDLITVEQKSGIGRLSAYCGAVSAGVGAGAGIAYLLDGSLNAISHTIVNAVAILSGTICDGAKPSCAAKIAASVDAGILGYQMYAHRQQFRGGEGIVTKGVDATIRNIGILAKEGMRQTDETILDIMTHRCD